MKEHGAKNARYILKEEIILETEEEREALMREYDQRELERGGN